MLRKCKFTSFSALESIFVSSPASSLPLNSRCLGAPAKSAAPSTLPEFGYTPPAYTGPSRDEVLKLRREFLSPGIFHHFKSPVLIVDGKMQYLFDETGRRYLDAFGGIVTVSAGHCHPKVNDAVQMQMSRLQHCTTIYLHHQIAQYGKEMAAKMPGNLKVCYFVNSGSEANDLALLMARVYSGNKDVVCLRNCYHGVSLGTMPACGHSTWRHDVGTSGMLHAMNPDPYRGAFGGDSDAYARDLQDLVRSGSSGRIAGFLAETIQGVGGAVPLADGYLPKAYEIIRAAGGLCIADEVQTGFGRTGSHYWGFERQGVVPDIVTMAKGIGNGLPLAAVVTTPEIASVLTQKLHLNTFGGNPVSCAAGRAVLKVVEEDGLQANSAKVGSYLMEQFKALGKKHSIIGDVRGAGLMLGVEFVRDRSTKEPASTEVAHVMETLKDKYSILIGKGGLDGNVFRIKPPMCFSQKDAEYLISSMDDCLSTL